MLGSTERRTDGQTDGRTENRTPISHLAKAVATKMKIKNSLIIIIKI